MGDRQRCNYAVINVERADEMPFTAVVLLILGASQLNCDRLALCFCGRGKAMTVQAAKIEV